MHDVDSSLTTMSYVRVTALDIAEECDFRDVAV